MICIIRFQGGVPDVTEDDARLDKEGSVAGGVDLDAGIEASGENPVAGEVVAVVGGGNLGIDHVGYSP